MKNLIAAAACAAAAVFGVEAKTLKLPVFGECEVVDAVDCTQTDHGFLEKPAGCSQIREILGRRCRVLPVDPENSNMFSYRLGAGKGLKPNGSYVIVLDYPDDLPRNYLLVNRATDSHRGFSTGRSLGDAWAPVYVDNHPEMISVPQSGTWQLWTCYTSLQDRTTDAADTQIAKDQPKFVPTEDGFDFAVTQYSRKHDPDTAGAAVSRIVLCEIPDETKCYAKINFPDGLPRRHIFWREEMSDAAPLQGGKDKRRCLDQLDWIRHKCRQMKMLGMDTYMKDLLEFGHVQHWDPNVIRPNWAWSADAESNSLWERIVDMVTKEYGFTLLPYFEWYGNLGADYQGKKAYGNRKPCEPLHAKEGDKKDSYTHIWWTEHGNFDVTDPDGLKATQELFDGTILRFKDRGRFLGAFFRNRPAAWPVGFAEPARKRFGEQANGGVTPSRDDLRRNRALYDKYIAWWCQKRADFLDACVTYLRDNGIKDAEVILDTDPAEAGPGLSGGGLVTDDVDYVKKTYAAAGVKVDKIVKLEDAVANHLYLKGRAEPAGTWGKWEWQHACPEDRPLAFDKKDGAMLAMPVNRMYSVMDPEAFAAYADKNGMTTMVRHQSLNEHNVTLNGEKGALVGYDMYDHEKAGRASMMIEVTAMAHGDIGNLGYLIGSCFARGFPAPVREFNLNFLALPALPSKVVAGASSDPEVTVREIDCSKQGKGTYYAIVHTGRTPKANVAITLPKGPETATFLADGAPATIAGGTTLTLPTLQPWQLLSLHR